MYVFSLLLSLQNYRRSTHTPNIIAFDYYYFVWYLLKKKFGYYSFYMMSILLILHTITGIQRWHQNHRRVMAGEEFA